MKPLEIIANRIKHLKSLHRHATDIVENPELKATHSHTTGAIKRINFEIQFLELLTKDIKKEEDEESDLDAAVDNIISGLQGRKGMLEGYDDIDAELQEEMREEIKQVISDYV